MAEEKDFGDKFVEFIDKYKTIITISLVFIIVIGVLLLFWSQKNNDKNQIQKSENIRAEVLGAVKNPGVYNLQNGAIVEDLIKKAGGLSDKIDKEKLASSINRAEKLSDGQKITIPLLSSSSQQVAGASSSTSSSSQSQNISGKINLNSASLAELDKLPGIGPAYAQRIIDYRQNSGGFKSISDIQNVKGIGPKTYEKLKDLISI